MNRSTPPKSPQTRAEQLSDQIGEAILTGEFGPGMRLDEHFLAARFGVSRTPVRDALRLLTGTGLIDLRHNRGVWVRSLSPAEIASLFVAMGEIEASCARLAAIAMSDDERSALDALHTRMARLAEAGDRVAYVEANLLFHQAIYDGAHNSVMSEAATSLRRRLRPYRTAQFELPGRLAQSSAEHGRVVRAVIARDGAAANLAMLAHMSVVEEAFEVQDAGPAEKRVPAAKANSVRKRRLVVRRTAPNV